MNDMKKFNNTLKVLQTAALILIALALMFPRLPVAVQTMAEGDSNFTNLVASGDITAGDDLTVGDDASVGGELTVTGTFAPSGVATLATLVVSGTSDLVGDVSSSTGAVTITDSLNVTGTVDLDNTLNVDGNATLNGTLDLDGNLTSGTGAVTITDSLNVTGTVDLDNTLNVDGNATLNGTLDLDGNLTSGTGAVTITDSLNVTGTVDLDNTLNVDGNATLNGTLDLDGNLTSGTGAVTITDSLNVTGAATFAALLYPSFANETITDGETLTATVTVYALDSAGAVTMTLAASGTEGQLLILIGDDANNITINDTNVRTNDGGVQVIGQYDVIMWIYQDSEWVEVAESNNS